MTRPSKLLFQNCWGLSTCFLLFSYRPPKGSKWVVVQHAIFSSSLLSKTFRVRIMSPVLLSDHMKHQKSQLKIPMACLRSTLFNTVPAGVRVLGLLSLANRLRYWNTMATSPWLFSSSSPRQPRYTLMSHVLLSGGYWKIKLPSSCVLQQSSAIQLMACTSSRWWMAGFACLKNIATRRHVSAEGNVAGKHTNKERLIATYWEDIEDMYKSLTLSPHASFLLYTHSLGASQKKTWTHLYDHYPFLFL